MNYILRQILPVTTLWQHHCSCMRRARQLAGKMPSPDVATQQHRMAEEKRGIVVFSALHTERWHAMASACLRRSRERFRWPSHPLRWHKPAGTPTMHPPDIDDKYDFIHVLSRNAYK
jgi:hypothetical protein